MRDQVEVLQRKGVKAANLDSTLGASESTTVKNGVRTGDIKILYIAPERSAFCFGCPLHHMSVFYRLNNESFVEMMRHVRISLFAVDEAHCISQVNTFSHQTPSLIRKQWGASFRPEYLKVARFAEELSVERVLCL